MNESFRIWVSRLALLIVLLMLLAVRPGILTLAQPGAGWFCRLAPNSGCPPRCTPTSAYECQYFPSWDIGYCYYNGGMKTCQDQYFDCGYQINCYSGLPTGSYCSIVQTCFDY